MTTAQDQQSRAEFDLWWKEHGLGSYDTQLEAWQAARALPARGVDPMLDNPAGMEPVGYLIDWPDEPELGHYFSEEANDGARSQALHTAAQVQAMGRVPLGWQITEDMHIAAVKVLHRASGVDGLPQRMVDAMLAAATRPPAA